jgi:hypothetical protein
MAVSHGWWYGARSDDTIYPLAPLALLDVDWKRPDWERHLEQAATYLPGLAVVPDVMGLGEIDRALAQAEALSRYCENAVIVPKDYGIIARLPAEVCGKALVLGYSIPTTYGGSPVPLWEFGRRPVHLLGGNPRRQLELFGYLNVKSLDGNLAWRLARRGVVMTARGIAGPTLKACDGRRWPARDMPLEALRRSLVNLRSFWDRHLGLRLSWSHD